MARFESTEANPGALREVGRLVIEATKMFGVSARYWDLDMGWVTEHPDGTIEPVADAARGSRPRTIRIAR